MDLKLKIVLILISEVLWNSFPPLEMYFFKFIRGWCLLPRYVVLITPPYSFGQCFDPC